uniref:Reverse transcriptase domain-containing protein n=1 Tax=Callorhinchus milii TaxID=7868 RepID=A0A4W3IAP3_CALMI
MLIQYNLYTNHIPRWGKTLGKFPYSTTAVITPPPRLSLLPLTHHHLHEIHHLLSRPPPHQRTGHQLPLLCPLLADVINQSLPSGSVHTSLKTPVITPLLKKPSLDPSNPSHYRPISNLPFLTKVPEHVVANQFRAHLSFHYLFEPLQSGFRSAHSTETALVKVTNDILSICDQGFLCLLVLLDLSTAFNTVDHTILLHRLSSVIHLSGAALAWFESYLINRQQYICSNGFSSRSYPVTCGVPQGSILGPLLFLICMLPLGDVIRRHGVHFHMYADDTHSIFPPHFATPSPLMFCQPACQTSGAA